MEVWTSKGMIKNTCTWPPCRMASQSGSVIKVTVYDFQTVSAVIKRPYSSSHNVRRPLLPLLSLSLQAMQILSAHRFLPYSKMLIWSLHCHTSGPPRFWRVDDNFCLTEVILSIILQTTMWLVAKVAQFAWLLSAKDDMLSWSLHYCTVAPVHFWYFDNKFCLTQVSLSIVLQPVMWLIAQVAKIL